MANVRKGCLRLGKALLLLAALLIALATAYCTFGGHDRSTTISDAVSGPAGVILFTQGDETRPCSYLECGESSFKLVASSAGALRLHRDSSGRLVLETLGAMHCKGHTERCMSTATHLRLRLRANGSIEFYRDAVRFGDELERDQPEFQPERQAIAWSNLHGIELADDALICIARGDVDMAATVQKTAPDVSMRRREQTLAVVEKRRAPPGAVCAPTRGVPRLADPEARVWLVDAILGRDGLVHAIYRPDGYGTVEHPDRSFVATFDGKRWTAKDLPSATIPGTMNFGQNVHFMDDSGSDIILDSSFADDGSALSLITYDLLTGRMTTERVRKR